MTMSLLGKAFITLAYSVVYVYGSEIFPTEVRNIGVGASSMFECIGGLVAPTIGGILVYIIIMYCDKGQMAMYIKYAAV